MKSQFTTPIPVFERRLPGADEPAPDSETLRRHETATLLMETAAFLMGPSGRDPAARRSTLRPLLSRLMEVIAQEGP
jgi:hypothetical protein